MYIKLKSYKLNLDGIFLAKILIKIHVLNGKLKAYISLNNGQDYELINQGVTEDEFHAQIDKSVKTRLGIDEDY